MVEIYEVYVKSQFSAAHCLKGYSGDCANVHGHNWVVHAYVEATALDKNGIAVDFLEVERELQRLVSAMDHTHLNDLPEFIRINPTSETIARYLFKALSDRINTVTRKVSAVRVAESDEYGVTYRINDL